MDWRAVTCSPTNFNWEAQDINQEILSNIHLVPRAQRNLGEGEDVGVGGTAVCIGEEHGAFENQISPGNSLRTSAPKPRPTFLGTRRGNHLQLDREGKVLLGGMDSSFWEVADIPDKLLKHFWDKL